MIPARAQERDRHNGGAFDPEMARLILEDVADLARLAGQEGHAVYCRQA
jgi:hypothetical protein